MRLNLFTSSSNSYWPLFCITLPNKLEYCLRWQVQLTALKEASMPTWGERQRMLLNTLNESDWVWFMGADTLIMNHTIDAHQFCDNNYDLIISEDYNGINNDVMFIKNSEASRKFFTTLVTKNKQLPSDQEAMKDMFKNNEIPDFKFKIVPQKLFNCYLYDTHVAYVSYPKDLPGTYKRGDFVLHFPGMGFGARMYEAQKYSQEVVR